MPGPGRNQPCPCGSGRKVKRCCGEHRGPSEDQLASAHLATLARDAVQISLGLSDEALDILWERPVRPPDDRSLPARQAPRADHPRTATTANAIADDDPDRGWDELTTVTEQIDTPQQRARLADAILGLRDQHRIRPHPSRLRDLRPQHPLPTTARRQPDPHHRRHGRRQPHPRRPPNRGLTPIVYPASRQFVEIWTICARFAARSRA